MIQEVAVFAGLPLPEKGAATRHHVVGLALCASGYVAGPQKAATAAPSID
jgi:hypothetical protein